MPELPEVEATRQNLERWTKRRRVRSVWADDERTQASLTSLEGRIFLGWHRRGKQLAAETDSPAIVLAAHLGMTGRWVPDPSPERPHIRVRIGIESGGIGSVQSVGFIDTRRFGAVTLVPSRDEVFAGLGPDFRDEVLSPNALALAMGQGKAPLKTRLMEQRRVSGLGNIAVIEAAYRARVHPHTPVERVDPTAWKRLSKAISDHLEATLSGCLGLDEYAYVSEGGENPFLVYGREGEPCGGCGELIVRTVLAGRPSFWCPSCQSESYGNRES